MNIKITHSWLLEYLDTKATPLEIQKYLSLCGPSVERIEKTKEGDVIYDIEITSNRIDTASVIGIAREAATILTNFGIKSTFIPPVLTVPEKVTDPLPLQITDKKKLCKRILAVIMDNVEIKPSNQLVQIRLEAAGIRSLNNLVDITNYVMCEMGHPTHVFDYDRIKTKKFIIRTAQNNEEIITLDNKKYKLCEKDVIIDDGTGRVIDLPGIMGTANSVITNDTKRIIFFIESNDPVSIRGSSMRYGIRTMAAAINEKSPDIELSKQTLYRGIELFRKYAKAHVASNIIDINNGKAAFTKIKTTFSFLNKRIGIAIPRKQIEKILSDLDFTVSSQNDELTVKVPSFRTNDVTIPEDLVEEVARIYGYDNLPNHLSPPCYIKQPKAFENLFVYQSKIKSFLKHLGLNEVLNYSMISKEMIIGLDFSIKNHLFLSNVMSQDIKYLRTTLIPSLIKNIKNNEGKKDVLKLFELAKVYLPRSSDLPNEIYKLSFATTTSFFDLKGIVEALLDELHIETCSFSLSKNSMFNNALQAKLIIGDKDVGELGQLKAAYQEKSGVKSNVFLCEIDFYTLISNAKPISQYVPIHPYAIIKLDHTMTLNKKISFEQFKQQAYKKSPLLNKIQVISKYNDKITIRCYFSSPSKNITEDEAKRELMACT